MTIKLLANTSHVLTVSEDLALLKVVDRHDSKEPAIGSQKPSCQESSREHQPKASICAEALAEMLKPYLPESTLTESGLTELFGSESEL